MKKLLFPPIVPNSLPAFNKADKLRYYFKPAITNSIEEIKHLQMSIVKMDTNRSILNSNDYPFDIIFKSRAEIKEDKSRGFWYVDIPASIFPTPDVPYKVQIRLGEADVSNSSTAQQGAILKDLDSMSEWSIVTLVMPITPPSFGVQDLTEGEETRISSTGFVFNGFYQPKDLNKQETLSSFKFNLYEGDYEEPNTWKLLSTSGDRYIGTNDRVNMEHVFPLELKEEHRYILTLTIKSKNLYVKTKQYKLYSAANPVLEMFDSIQAFPNSEEAQMDLIIHAKQILMEPENGAELTYIKDEPGKEQYPNMKATHLKIKGSIIDKGDFLLQEKDGSWICQFKAFFPEVKNSLAEIVKEPTLEIFQDVPIFMESEYFTKIKVGAMKINLAYPTTGNLNPDPEWEYRFIIRKEVLVKEYGKEKIVLSQNKIVRRKNINPKQEYYFFIKEECGALKVDVKETYLSSNSEI